MTWFYIFWTMCAISIMVSLYLTVKVVDKVINLNTVRINENKKRMESFEKRLLGGEDDKS